ncbi:MAG: hypothetical protein HYV07_17750 [Deltaproteobacteria bacterium]|nr:hypothetical protein [Deltaproteobacteria bacterium]
MRALVFLAALTAPAPALAFDLEGGPSEAVFPRQSIPLLFDHAVHARAPDEAKGLDGAHLRCTYCHGAVETSRASSDVDLPGHATCAECHDEWLEQQPEGCAKCHVATTSSIAPPLDLPAPRLVFSHAAHTNAEIACTDCHKEIPRRTLATRADFPTMDRCVACHEDRGAPTTCGTCHLTRSDGRVLTDLQGQRLQPTRFFSSAIHDRRFTTDHSSAARNDRSLCAKCHTDRDCLECHDGLGRDARYHGGDWIAVHGVRAKHDDPSCESCHRAQGFCLDCHVRSGVATLGSAIALDVGRRTIHVDPRTSRATSPHPMELDGWLNPRSRNFHGFAVQRNIRSCASCHQEQWCIRCHGSSARGPSLGGNPHGPNPQRLRGSAAQKQSARMCLKCHSPLDVAWREP